MSKQFCIYILTNKNNSVFYTGITSDLIRRVSEHKSKMIPGFTAKYGVSKLVYYESADDPETAIEREKQIKHYRREKKIASIISQNPGMMDLFDKIAGDS